MNVTGKITGSGFNLRRYTVVLSLLWTVMVALSLVFTYSQEKDSVNRAAVVAARNQFLKDEIYRRWNSNRGGVYVPVSDVNRPNPYLTQVKERDITTTTGRRLTMINPAYMTRQVHELGYRTGGVRGHITSLDPIRPGNAPDEWGKRALLSFREGAEEAVAQQEIDGDKYLRLMRPLMVEKSCLQCHAQQGYRVGEVRGGISVSVPMKSYEEILRSKMKIVAAGHSLLWSAVLALIIFGGRRMNRHEIERKRAEEELEEAYSEKKDLLRELQHRAKNSFSLIHGLINLVQDTSESRDVQSTLEEIATRVKAVSEMYDLLYESDSVTEIELNEYLGKVSGTLPGLSGSIELSWVCEPVTVPVKTAIPLGIITVELMTNSIKHAFPQNGDGLIHMILRKTDTGAVIEISDNGVGLPPGFDMEQVDSMGITLVRALSAQIDGTFAMTGDNGTRCVVEFPVDFHEDEYK